MELEVIFGTTVSTIILLMIFSRLSTGFKFSTTYEGHLIHIVNKPFKTILIINGEMVDEYKQLFAIVRFSLTGYIKHKEVQVFVYPKFFRTTCLITVNHKIVFDSDCVRLKDKSKVVPLDINSYETDLQNQNLPGNKIKRIDRLKERLTLLEINKSLNCEMLVTLLSLRNFYFVERQGVKILYNKSNKILVVIKKDDNFEKGMSRLNNIYTEFCPLGGINPNKINKGIICIAILIKDNVIENELFELYNSLKNNIVKSIMDEREDFEKMKEDEEFSSPIFVPLLFDPKNKKVYVSLSHTVECLPYKRVVRFIKKRILNNKS